MSIDKTLSVKADHLSLFNLNLATSSKIFFDLGFVRGGGRTALDAKVMEMTAPTVRFVFDNAYIESVQFPPEISEFYSYLNTPAGIHIMALLTPDAEGTLARFSQAGMEIDELERVTRSNVDYGDRQGSVIFDLVPIPEEIIPRVHVAFLEHKTHDLMYQPTRCAHLNGVTRLEEAVLCCSGEEECGRIEAKLTELARLARNSECDGGMNSLRLMDTDTFAAAYGTRPSEQGSPFAALRFGTPDLAETRRFLRLSDYVMKETEHGLRVFPPFHLGLVLDFTEI